MFEIRPAFVLGFLSLTAALGVEPVKEPSDFFSAASDCESRGLSLPVAKTDQEYAAFLRVLETSKIDQDIWLGIYKPDEDSQYRWLGQNAEQGELLTTYWAMDEPNHLPKEHCVRLKAEDNYLWNTRICSDKSEYVCVDYMKSEYDFEVVTRRTTYENAREDCQSKGKDLLMIKTQHKQDEITKFLRDQSTVIRNVWIGLYFYGTSAADLGKFRWIDGEHLKTSNFIQDNPQSSAPTCIFLNRSSEFKWTLRSCDVSTKYICTTSFSETDAVYINNGYTKIGNDISPYSTPLAEITTNSVMKCAARCARITSCRLFTKEGNNCQFYKDSNLEIYKSTPGRSVWRSRNKA